MHKRKVGDRGRPVLFTILAALFSSCLLLLFFSDSFFDSFVLFFVNPLTNRYYLGNMIAFMVPLIVAGLGISFAFESHNFNLGGEGQIYAGSLAAVLVAIALKEKPAIVIWVFSFAAAAAAGGLIGALSGFLKRRLAVDELISSFLVSSIVVLVVDFCITGPFQDPSSNFQATRAIPPAATLPKLLPPSSLSAGIFAAVLALLIGKFVLARTRFGFELRLCGANKDFARYAGIDDGVYALVPMLLSGALHGIAGALMIFGSYGRLMRGFSTGVGWSAIAVALIARNNPLALLPAAAFYAYLDSGAKSVMMGSGASTEIVGIIQAVIFLFITATRLPFLKTHGLFARLQRTVSTGERKSS
ncbi:MAG: ABC transporter permease [Spirochaetia bacterium]|nr:ABC transporter permease [Spirochaetia bacterium]